MNLTEIHPRESYWQSEPGFEGAIPVAKPRLPLADEIAPYLRRMDQSRWYSNGGPLVQEFETRLAAHAGEEEIIEEISAKYPDALVRLTSKGLGPSWT